MYKKIFLQQGWTCIIILMQKLLYWNTQRAMERTFLSILLHICKVGMPTMVLRSNCSLLPLLFKLVLFPSLGLLEFSCVSWNSSQQQHKNVNAFHRTGTQALLQMNTNVHLDMSRRSYCLTWMAQYDQNCFPPTPHVDIKRLRIIGLFSVSAFSYYCRIIFIATFLFKDWFCMQNFLWTKQ